jgi:chromosomal replication initiation ATPase DnaA
MVKLEDILLAVSAVSGISVEKIKEGGGIKGKRQAREVTTARQVYCFVARKMTGCSLCEIGRVINRDHSTVLYSIRIVQGYVDVADGNIIDVIGRIKFPLKLLI